MRRPLALLLAAAAASCVGPPPAREPVQPRPAPERALPPPRPEPPAADWRDRALTPGVWVYQRDSRGSRALFGTGNADALATLRCDRAAGQVFLSRAGASLAPLTVRTTSANRTLPVRPTGGTLPFVAVALAPTDPLLDAVAFSRGKLVIEQPGAPTLVLPAWAEIGRVVEDCRA